MPFAASDRNCSFAAKTRKLSYATNFTKPHGIQQNRMAGYPKIMCHFHGRLYPLFRPVQCISRGKVESGIQSLGQHLRFISPALRTSVRHDNGNASAARKNVVRKILQKYTVPMWYLYMLIGLYLYMPFFSLWVERATRKQKKLFLGLWSITLFLPYAYSFFSPELFGTCAWNSFGTFY